MNYQLPNIQGFHIEATNICTLKCSECARTKFIKQWPQHWKNHSIDIDLLFKFIDLDINNYRVLLCGNYGDPIYHPEFHQLVLELKNRGAILHIVTNGSYRPAAWWQQLCDLLTATDTVTFSVDGLPDNFTQYRVNADWASIEVGMRMCASASCQTKWKYIPFLYNQHCIDSARELSQTLGIDQFIVAPSNRFDQNNTHLVPTKDLIDTRHWSQIQWKKSNNDHGIDPLCADQRQHFISADGYYVPCCFLSDHRFLYKTPWGKQREQFSISNTTLSKILKAETTINFNKDLAANSACHYFCSKV